MSLQGIRSTLHMIDLITLSMKANRKLRNKKIINQLIKDRQSLWMKFLVQHMAEKGMCITELLGYTWNWVTVYNQYRLLRKEYVNEYK